MADRAWQAGDLCQTRGGVWGVIILDGVNMAGETWVSLDTGDHKINIGNVTADPDWLTLLAAADAPLWEALRGLPRAHEDMAGALWIALGGAPGTGCSGMHLRKGLPPVFRPANRSFADDLPELKQAIQRFEALQQFIAQHREAANGVG